MALNSAWRPIATCSVQQSYIHDIYIEIFTYKFYIQISHVYYREQPTIVGAPSKTSPENFRMLTHASKMRPPTCPHNDLSRYYEAVTGKVVSALLCLTVDLPDPPAKRLLDILVADKAHHR